MISSTATPRDAPGKAIPGRAEPDSELYFGDTSSYTISVHNDGSNESAMYEEIQGHRYDTIHRPLDHLGKVNLLNDKSCLRSSWDGHNQRSMAAIHQAQPRSRHSADTVGKDKMFSPIVVPKFVNCSSSGTSSWMSIPTETTDTCSFVPYRRAAVVPNHGRFDEAEVYENVTDLDFDNKARTLSPDEEVAIITSQFCAPVTTVDQEGDSTHLDSELDDNESIIRAVNV